MTDFYWHYLYTFVQSNFLEVPFYFFFYRRALSLKEVLVLVTLSNLITHPLVFFGFMAGPLSYLWAILVAELFAVLTEGYLHHRYGALSIHQTFRASLIANLASWQLAPLLTLGGRNLFLFLS